MTTCGRVVRSVDLLDTDHDLVHVADGLLGFGDAGRREAALLEELAELLGKTDVRLLLVVEVRLEFAADGVVAVSEVVVEEL